MIKKIFTLLLFITAISVVIAHSVIPHHHHEEEVTTEHHDKEHDDDDNGLDNLFSHFQHIGVHNEFVYTHQPTLVKQIDIPQGGFAFITFYSFTFSDTGEPVPIHCPDDPDIYFFSGSSAFSLRGPPSFTV